MILDVKSMKFNRVLYCSVSTIMVLLGISVSGQTVSERDLTLTGTVVEVIPRFVRYLDKKEIYKFDVDLLLTFRNNSKLPIIIFRPDGFYGTRKITFLRDVSPISNAELSTTSIVWKNPYADATYNPVNELVRELMWPSEWNIRPSQYHFVLIDPESSYECRERFTVQNGFKVVELKENESDQSPKLSVVPEFPALKVSYFFSLRNRREHPNPLEKARESYKKFGQLLLDPNGDFSVKSQIIINLLPE